MYGRYCKLRDDRKLKDSDVAKAIEITPSTFSDWKKGKSAPNVDKLCKLAQFFKVSLDYLVTGTSPAPPPSASEFTDSEKQIIIAYRKADEVDKRAVERILGLEAKKENAQTA